jgi:hypothetical protein
VAAVPAVTWPDSPVVQAAAVAAQPVQRDNNRDHHRAGLAMRGAVAVRQLVTAQAVVAARVASVGR